MKVRGTIRAQLSVHAPDDVTRQKARKSVDRDFGRAPTDGQSCLTYDEIAMILTARGEKISGATVVKSFQSAMDKLRDGLSDILEDPDFQGYTPGELQDLMASVLSSTLGAFDESSVARIEQQASLVARRGSF